MTQRSRILIAVVVLLAVVALVLGTDALRRLSGNRIAAGAQVTLKPGDIPIYLNGELVAGFQPGDLSKLTKVSFVEPAEGKTQEGWLLRDVILLYVPRNKLGKNALVTVSSTSRDKSAQVTWTEADDLTNQVMFDLSNRGTLKLVSVLEKLDDRDEWVQDADRIEVQN